MVEPLTVTILHFLNNSQKISVFMSEFLMREGGNLKILGEYLKLLQSGFYKNGQTASGNGA